MDNLLFRIELQGSTESVQELGRLRGELQSLKNEENGLNAARKAGTITEQKYQQGMAVTALKADAVKKETANLTKETKAATTAFLGAEGSMVRLSNELANNRTKYRALSEAERENAEVGGKLLTVINSQDEKIKKLDASIGNHQRNVGDYGRALSGLGGQIGSNIPLVGNLAAGFGTIKETMAGVTQASGSTGMGMMALGGIIGIATASFGGLVKVFHDVMNSTDTMQDKWQEMTQGMTFAYDNFLGTIASGDWSGFLENLTQAYDKGVLYAQLLDDIEEKQGGFKMSQAKDKEIMADLTVDMRNRLLSEDQRVKAGQQYLEISKKIAGQEVGLAKDAIKANTLMAEQKTKLGIATIVKYLEERPYNQEKIDKATEYIKSVKELDDFQKRDSRYQAENLDKKTQLENVVKNTSYATKIFAGTMTAVNQLSAEQKNQVIDGYVKISAARADFKESTIRASTVVNSLLAKQGDMEAKNATQAEKGADKTIETLKVKAENQLKLNVNMIAANDAVIVGMTRKMIDAQIAAMVDGAEKEKALAKDKFEDDKVAIALDTEKRLRDIQGAIDDTKAVKPTDKAGKDQQLADIAKFEAQKLDIVKNGNALNEENARLHQAKLVEIEGKFSGKTEDGKITKDYSVNVANAVAENDIQLEVTKQFYLSKGTLTKGEEQQQAADILKINLDLFTKKYELLKAELEARKKAGFISVEDEKAALAEIAKLYGQVKTATGQGTDAKEKPKDFKGKVTGGMASMFGITDAEASQVYDKAAEVLAKIGSLWTNAQQNKIKAELKAENAKLDAMHKQELKSLDAQKKKGLLTERQYNERKEKLEEQTQIKKDKLAREAFEKNKKIQLLNAIIGGAVAVIQAAAIPIIGTVMAILTGILVAAEIGTIMSTKYEGAKGGMLRGASHAQGGIKYAMGGDVLELEGGEAVLNKRAMESNDVMSLSGTPRQIASRVNSYRGWGIPFASGGYTPSANPRSLSGIANSSSMTQAIANALGDQKVYLVESEMTELQGKVRKVKVESTW